MGYREGLVVYLRLTPTGGNAEKNAGLEMPGGVADRRRITVGADRGYDSWAFVRGYRDLEVTPHVAPKRRSAIDGRITRHKGYRLSQRTRNLIEEKFGRMKTEGRAGNWVTAELPVTRCGGS